MQELCLPSEEQVAEAVAAMRKAHQSEGYARPMRDHYVETLFWAGFFAAHLKSRSCGHGQ
jgi:hypothetical protein